MPTYEYKCPNGHNFDLFQKMSEEPRALCPTCGLVSERLLSGGAGFLFKGGGFYATDYRSESYKKDASKETSTGMEEKASASGSGSKKKPEGGDGKSKGPAKSGGSSAKPSSEGS